jgi:hypothetical protein
MTYRDPVRMRWGSGKEIVEICHRRHDISGRCRSAELLFLQTEAFTRKLSLVKAESRMTTLLLPHFSCVPCKAIERILNTKLRCMYIC